MSVLETVTVDNVTYDMHDPKVGSGTLTTTAQTLIPAVNELKSGLSTVSGKTDVIGSGSLNTTSQTLIGAVNELASKNMSIKEVSWTGTVPYHSDTAQQYHDIGSLTVTKPTTVLVTLGRATKSHNLYVKTSQNPLFTSCMLVPANSGWTGNGVSCGDYPPYLMLLRVPANTTITARFYMGTSYESTSYTYGATFIYWE